MTRNELTMDDGGDQFLGHAIGEILLAGITGVIVQRQDRQRVDARNWLRDWTAGHPPGIGTTDRTALDRSYESVSPMRERFDESRLVGVVPQHVAEPVDGLVETAIEVDKGVVRPELSCELLPRHQFARVLEQEQEHLQRLFLQLHPGTLATQLARARIDFENPKTDWLQKSSLGESEYTSRFLPSVRFSARQSRRNPVICRSLPGKRRATRKESSPPFP